MSLRQLLIRFAKETNNVAFSRMVINKYYNAYKYICISDTYKAKPKSFSLFKQFDDRHRIEAVLSFHKIPLKEMIVWGTEEEQKQWRCFFRQYHGTLDKFR